MTSTSENRHILTGKTAIVTGGARGIGASIASRLARGGAKVAVTFHTSRDEAHELVARLKGDGGDALAIKADSGSPAEIAAAMSLVAATFGGIDMLVNNTGLSHSGPIATYDLDRFEQMVSINIVGVFHAIREALRYMPEGGRIVNIGSISSEYMPYPGNSVYSMTKGAMQGLTHGLVRELAERGIMINTVQPGRIDTDMLRERLASRFDQVESETPLRRFGEPHDVAGLVEFLCGPDATYITGANLRVDGGISA